MAATCKRRALLCESSVCERSRRFNGSTGVSSARRHAQSDRFLIVRPSTAAAATTTDGAAALVPPIEIEHSHAIDHINDQKQQ